MIVALTVVGLLVLAGAGTAAYLLLQPSSREDAEEVARVAATRLEEDQGKDGDLSSMTMRIQAKMQEGANTMDMRISATLTTFAPDGMRIQMTFDSVEMNGEPFTIFDGAKVTLLCTPDRLVLQTDGFDFMGEDKDVETANDSGRCLEAEGDPKFQDSMKRLATEDDPASSFTEMFTGDGDETRTVKSARYEGDDVLAQYSATTGEGKPMVVNSTIRDGRIVSESANLRPEEGTDISMEVNYTYGPRGSVPTVRGATKV